MQTLLSKLLTDSDIEDSSRLIGKIIGNRKSPTIIVFAGIHGNEKAGVVALENIIQKIEEENISFRGNFYAIKGNLKALKSNKRFEDVDLNRIWTRSKVHKLLDTDSKFSEIEEQKSIYKHIKDILYFNNGPFYFLDLHTTSSNTEPFITISDSLSIRKFTSKFTLPVILGIEEYLDGPLLTYLNEFGHISLGFEAGQHDDEASIINCENFVWVALVKSGCVRMKSLKNYKNYKATLHSNKPSEFYQINYKYQISKDEEFKMEEGFHNFQQIKKGQLLAISNGKKIVADRDGLIFMPLYQNKGDDGFFIISKVSKFWLFLSRVVRKLGLYQILRLLPGVKKASHYTLRVNPKTARFLTTKIFHLFGYRKRVKRGERLYFTKRDRKITPMH
tara:strand:+ start:1061 stop:2230 length:1170 start_codon:yes stop_codon:yes gene_type:complete